MNAIVQFTSWRSIYITDTSGFQSWAAKPEPRLKLTEVAPCTPAGLLCLWCRQVLVLLTTSMCAWEFRLGSFSFDFLHFFRFVFLKSQILAVLLSVCGPLALEVLCHTLMVRFTLFCWFFASYTLLTLNQAHKSLFSYGCSCFILDFGKKISISQGRYKD